MRKRTLHKLLWAAATLLTSSAILCGAGANEEIIKLDRYGLSFRAPRDWFVPEHDKVIENIKKLDSEKEDIPAVLASHRGSIPIATYLRHDPRGQTGVIPTIKVVGRPNPHKTFEAFREMIAASVTSVGSVLRNYSIKTPLADSSVAGRRAVAFTAEYELSLANGSTSRVEVTTYGIPCGDIFLQVSMSESQPAKNRDVFDRFIKSFAFKEP